MGQSRVSFFQNPAVETSQKPGNARIHGLNLHVDIWVAREQGKNIVLERKGIDPWDRANAFAGKCDIVDNDISGIKLCPRKSAEMNALYSTHVPETIPCTVGRKHAIYPETRTSGVVGFTLIIKLHTVILPGNNGIFSVHIHIMLLILRSSINMEPRTQNRFIVPEHAPDTEMAVNVGHMLVEPCNRVVF